MFVLVRNARAAGFLQSSPVTAYISQKATVASWLNQLRSLASGCQEVHLAQPYIKAAVEALASLPSSSSEREGSPPSSSCKARAACLRLIAGLDAVYGELVVAAVEAGTSLPDPRLYLETLVGQRELCGEGGGGGKGPTVDATPPPANPLLRYLELRDLEAQALGLVELCRGALEAEGGLQAGPDEGTMRGSDPVTCPSVRAWWDACRDRVAAWSAFACPDGSAVEAIKDFARGKGVVEVSPKGTCMPLHT
jgi:hypothetical protein